MARATADTDLVADLRLEHAEPLAQALIDVFYVDAESIRDAVRRRRSFNVIYLETMFKVDVFVRKQRSFAQAQFEHRAAYVIARARWRLADPQVVNLRYVAPQERHLRSNVKFVGQSDFHRWLAKSLR